MTIRYGAKSPDQLRNRELEATTVETWATTLTAVYETDPEAIAAVLPQPLTPKLADVTLQRDGESVRAWFARMGVTFVEIEGRITAEGPTTPDRTRTDFYYKFLLDPAGKGFDADPSLVHCHRDEKTRSVHVVDGTITLRESKFDPVVDLPVRAVRFIEFAERSSKQYGEIVRTVPGEWVMPFVHQRYDDLSVVGTE